MTLVRVYSTDSTFTAKQLLCNQKCVCERKKKSLDKHIDFKLCLGNVMDHQTMIYQQKQLEWKHSQMFSYLN